MNREFKFRVWDIEAKKMLPWEDVFYSTVLVRAGTVSGINEDIQVPFLSIAMMGPKYVVQQYTGLKLESGQEIYEGDIINTKLSRYKVIYENSMSSFVGLDLMNGKIGSVVALSHGLLLGNIFEDTHYLNI